MKKTFIGVYDYGTGGLWFPFLANSVEQISARFPEIKPFASPPEWMDNSTLDFILKKPVIDVDLSMPEKYIELKFLDNLFV